MKEYSARFVGEFGKVEYHDWKTTVPNIGDVAIIQRERIADGPVKPHLLIRCACSEIDYIPLLPTDGGWTLTSRDPVHIEPSVRVEIPGVTLCHYFVRGGQLQMLDDTTSPLK